MNERTSGTNGRTNEFERIRTKIKRTNERKLERKNYFVYEWMDNERTKEWINKWMNDKTNRWVKKQIDECVSEWIGEPEWFNEKKNFMWINLNERINERNSETNSQTAKFQKSIKQQTRIKR